MGKIGLHKCCRHDILWCTGVYIAGLWENMDIHSTAMSLRESNAKLLGSTMGLLDFPAIPLCAMQLVLILSIRCAAGFFKLCTFTAPGHVCCLGTFNCYGFCMEWSILLKDRPACDIGLLCAMVTSFKSLTSIEFQGCETLSLQWAPAAIGIKGTWTVMRETRCCSQSSCELLMRTLPQTLGEHRRLGWVSFLCACKHKLKKAHGWKNKRLL